MTSIYTTIGIIDFKQLNVNQLRSICKEYKIPLNGAKNKKELLHLVMARKQIFKPRLPLEIDKLILLNATLETIFAFKCACQYVTIDNSFWKEKLYVEFNDVKPKQNYLQQYIKIATYHGNLFRGSERYIPIKECLKRSKYHKTYLYDYFEKIQTNRKPKDIQGFYF